MNTMDESQETGPLCVFYSNLYNHIKTWRISRTDADLDKPINLNELFDSTQVTVDENSDTNEIILELLGLDSAETQIPSIYIETYMNFDSVKEIEVEEKSLLIERWTLSIIGNSKENDYSANMVKYLNLYLKNGEISKFIDQHRNINNCLKISTSFETKSTFVDKHQHINFPSAKCGEKGEAFSISVEWLPLRANVTVNENILYYKTSDLSGSKLFQVTIQSPEVEKEPDFSTTRKFETQSPLKAKVSALVDSTGKMIVPPNVIRIKPEMSPSSTSFDEKQQMEVSPQQEKNLVVQSTDPKDPRVLSKMIKSTSIERPNRYLDSYLNNLLSLAFYPVGFVRGFTVKITFTRKSYISKEINLPVISFFFDNRANNINIYPYLGYVDLRDLNPCYKIKKSGMIHIILLTTEDFVRRMFFIKFKLPEMSPNSIAYIRHVVNHAPVDKTVDPVKYESFLQFCVFLRVKNTEKNEKILFQDIRLVFPFQPLEISYKGVKYALDSETIVSTEEFF